MEALINVLADALHRLDPLCAIPLIFLLIAVTVLWRKASEREKIYQTIFLELQQKINASIETNVNVRNRPRNPHR